MPNNTGQKDVETILGEQIRKEVKEYERSKIELFYSALGAGMEVGFSVFLMAVLYTMFHDELPSSIMHTLLAFAYPIGFIFVILGRSELFTEHATLAVLPVLDGQIAVRKLLILWGVIFLGNIVGGYLFALLISIVGPELKVLEEASFLALAKKMVADSWLVILFSGVLAGWLMGLLSWLVTASNDTISRIVLITMITSVIGIGGLHHSIVGSIEVFCGFLIDRQTITLFDYGKFQSMATIGNMVGGTIFVAMTKYSHTPKIPA